MRLTFFAPATSIAGVTSIALAASLLLASCGAGGSSGPGYLILDATDTPFVHSIVTEARIWVDRITVAEAADADGGFVTLYDGAPMEMDLLSLRNGVTQTLVQQTALPPGAYRQIRLRVDRARLTLENGNVYTSDDGSLHLTSQDTSGFKVFVDPPIQIASGVSSRLLLDFDLTKTFHPIPSNDALTATSYSLHPVIHVANLSTTGEIRGIVSASDGNGGVAPVADATVYVLPPGETDPATSVASTATNASGAYDVLGLAPGTYDVRAVHGVLDGLAAGQAVLAGAVTSVDIVID